MTVTPGLTETPDISCALECIKIKLHLNMF